ncbi:unnamed protein product, partial [Iphiclides podalirius]
MNKFCKSGLCVEKVRERYVLIGRRVVAVPGGVDAIRHNPDLLSAVGPQLSSQLDSWPLGLELGAVRTDEDAPAEQPSVGTC